MSKKYFASGKSYETLNLSASFLKWFIFGEDFWRNSQRHNYEIFAGCLNISQNLKAAQKSILLFAFDMCQQCNSNEFSNLKKFKWNLSLNFLYLRLLE